MEFNFRLFVVVVEHVRAREYRIRIVRSLSIYSFWPAENIKLVLVSVKGKFQGACVHFPATTLQIPALRPTEAGELSGSDPRAGPFWPEPVLRTRAFHLRTDWPGRTDWTNGERPLRLKRVSWYLSVQIVQVDISFLGNLDNLDLVTSHLSAGRVGAVCGDWNQANLRTEQHYIITASVLKYDKKFKTSSQRVFDLRTSSRVKTDLATACTYLCVNPLSPKHTT